MAIYRDPKYTDNIALRRVDREREPCLWPYCLRPRWNDLRIPLCPLHAAKVHLAVEEVKPPSKSALKARHQRDPERKLVLGVVYFARVGDYIKIGFSTNIKSRLAALRGEYGSAELLAQYSGTTRDERAAQMRFGEYYVERELFTPGPRLMEYLESLGSAAA